MRDDPPGSSPAPSSDVRVVRPRGPLTGRLVAPGSKSHALRELVAAALADGVSRLTALPGGEDVEHGRAALVALGIDVNEDGDALVVTGCGGALPHRAATLDVGGSGTALRLLTAVCALGAGPCVVDGDASLRARPVGGLADALRDLGARIDCTDGRPPVSVEGPVHGGVSVALDARRSSQGLSALLLAGAVLPGGLTVRATGPLVSRGYVDLTLGVLAGRGVAVDVDVVEGGELFRVRGGRLLPRDVRIAGDWSSAAFLLALGPATGGRLTVTGLREDEQPDRRIVEVLGRFGARTTRHTDGATATGALRRPVDVDLGGAPDLAPLVGALACCVEGTTRVRGAAHLVLKESDRIGAVVAAARALGCAAERFDDGFAVTGPLRHGGAVDTRDDHRLAMAFAVAGASEAARVAGAELRIGAPSCVAKSFPGFWDVFDGLDRLDGHGAARPGAPDR